MIETILGCSILTCDHCGYELPLMFESRDEAIAARKASNWERRRYNGCLEDWCGNCCAALHGKEQRDANH